MTLEEIKACLEREGWPVEAVTESTMRSRFHAAGKHFPLYVHLALPYVMFAVIPFAKLPPGPDAADVLVRRLLRLNREINLAKFSADEDGDVVLSVEYRLQDLDPSEIRDAVNVLAFYTDRYHAEVHRLASA